MQDGECCFLDMTSNLLQYPRVFLLQENIPLLSSLQEVSHRTTNKTGYQRPEPKFVLGCTPNFAPKCQVLLLRHLLPVLSIFLKVGFCRLQQLPIIVTPYLGEVYCICEL